MYNRLLPTAHKGWLYLEEIFNRVFSPRFNPLYYLGAISFFFLWLVLVSGIYLLFYYRINVDEAYKSLEYITNEQWYLGGIMRSIHRYSSDGLMLAMLLHLVKEFLNDRYHNWRWVAWVTGVVLIVTFWAAGVTGYWMVWDQRAQVIASTTTKFADFLPIFGEPLQRAFLSNGAVSNLLFIGVIFIHLSIPTLLLAAAWLHVLRISRPVINPPAALNWAIGILLFIMCLAAPAASKMPADLSVAKASFGIDWFYLPIYPLMYALPVWYSWSIIVGGIALITILPWLPRFKRLPKAEVILENCNGCELCFKDCPYEAVFMKKRSDGRPYEFEAVVAEEKCASCGFCIGSCDFHAIDLPDRTEKDINEEISNLLKLPASEPKILAVICNYGVNVKGLINPDTRALKDMPHVRVLHLPCIAMLQSSMMEYAFKAGAGGIFISGCEVNDCHYREGNKWLEQRLLNNRPPVLKKKEVDPQKIRAAWMSAIHRDRFLDELKGFSNELKAKKVEKKMILHQFIKERLTVPGIIILALAAVVTLYISNTPYTFFGEKDSLLIFSFKHSGKPSKVQKALSEEQLAKLPKHMRSSAEVVLKRFPVYAEIYVDNKKVLARSFKPAGLWENGSSFAFEKVVTEPMVHKITIKMSESNNTDKFDYVYEDTVDFKPGMAVAFDFDEKENRFFIAR
ncbi:MAG: hypothetical protein A2073_08515 [Deltaproteobacteria bacterium GWC2_42_11]|nr:MAG: hypothetical protein A2073_08515 [Deltaproteobacteria bacterium GWC2_42_11]